LVDSQGIGLLTAAHLSDKLPEARRLEFHFGAERARPGIAMDRQNRSLWACAPAGGELTPVMARLGPTDLETLDTLIEAGIASNRADAVRWALAWIWERPPTRGCMRASQTDELIKHS
jgi:hypothetical protein